MNTPAPLKVNAHAPVQSSNGSVLMSGLFGTVAEGMAFGTGSAVARAAVSSFNSDDKHHATHAARASEEASVCSDEKKAFMDCLGKTCNDIFACQSYQEMLNQCKHENECQ